MELFQMTKEEKVLIENLYSRYSDQLRRYATNEIKSEILAQDLVQDTFYEAMNMSNIQKLESSVNQIGWLVNTLKNKIRNYQKRLKNHEYLEENLIELETIEDEYGLTELNIVLKKALTKQELFLFHMYFVERHSVKEMAKMQGIQENTFKVKMNRIRKKIIKELEVTKKK